MRELRRDPVVNRWVIISSERAGRPMDAFHVAPENPEAYCPFCEGVESATPPELFALRPQGMAPNGPGWSLRVVPNKFPALGDPGAHMPSTDGLYEKMDGVGRHEVIIETPGHGQALADMPLARAIDIFHTLQGRLLAMREDPALACAQYFKNHGRESGASLSHSHSQLIAMPVVSRTLGEELSGAAAWRIRNGECVYCHILRHEKNGGGRLIAIEGNMAVLSPFASRFPYEAMIMPVEHSCRFEDSTPELIGAFTALLLKTLSTLNALFDNPPYNLVLHSAPFSNGHEESYHWHMEVIPVMARAAGFEWGSGFHINSIPPEKAATRMREAMR
ncbi:MAG: galactose-1-phosphate uridylyltransferase [Nitrospinota bacterium]|nr:galactose-1-phosphate uridylyltransferase [Nitrospinota bacterium]